MTGLSLRVAGSFAALLLCGEILAAEPVGPLGEI
jgi:hypothetical protein